MPIQHYSVVANDGWTTIARKLSPVGVTDAQVAAFAAALAVQNGTTVAATLSTGRVLHFNDASIPVPPPPVDPPVDPPPVDPPPATDTINEVFSFATTLANFVPIRGALAIASGVLRPTSPITEVDAYHKTDLGSQDHEVTATFVIGPATSAPSWHAINARMATTGLTYYSVETGGGRGSLELLKVVNGSYTPLGSWTTGWAANSTHTVTLRCQGTSIKVLVDGAERIAAIDAASGRPTGTRVGVHCFLATVADWAWDNFVANKIGAVVTPPPVDPPPVTPPPTTTGEFYTKNGRIGRDGKQFVGVGLNGVPTSRSAAANPGQWWNDTGMGVMNGRSPVFVQQGFNFVRFNEMRDYGQFSFDDWQGGMFDAMDEYLARGVTVMPAYHSVGPGTNPTPAALGSNATFQNFWSQVITRYKANPNVWVNPLNEPIGTAWDQWETLGNYQYTLMRNQGWTGVIVIDLPQWAQGINIGAARMAAFLSGKTKCVLGFHNYGMGDQTATVLTAQAMGVPIFIGECGETWPGGADRAGMEWSVAQADALGIGCVPWWGAGNRNDNYVLFQRTGSTFYDTNLAPTNMGTKVLALAANRPAQPVL